jgi:hypothetical protein
MATNPYQSTTAPEELPTQLAGGSGRGLLILGIVFAIVNLLTSLSIGVRETLVYFDPVPALILYLVGFVAGMIVIPRCTTGALRSGQHRGWPVLVAMILVLLEFTWLFNVAIGAFCRGPNWNFFWPWEERDPYRVVPLNHVDLSEIFWFRLGFQARPAEWLLREAPGFVALTLWLVVVSVAATWLLHWRWPQLVAGRWRLLAACFLIQFMALLPLKMLLRTGWALKYIVSLPEFGLNV